jgi:hypothetical protein
MAILVTLPSEWVDFAGNIFLGEEDKPAMWVKP